jgi:inner membrane protein
LRLELFKRKACHCCFIDGVTISLADTDDDMLILGHAGITLGVVVLADGALSWRRTLTAEESSARSQPQEPVGSGSGQIWSPGGEGSRPARVGRRIDVRLLLLGSLLPDIIDKPIGQYFFLDTFSNGRIFCHTLLFVALISLVGLYLYRARGKVWLLVLSFGTFAHLILDQMWLVPRTLLWPLYGVDFPTEDLTGWTVSMSDALLNNPTIYVPELLGAAILISFVVALARRKKVHEFLKNGRVL